MESNSPECVAENVKRALDSPELVRISEMGDSSWKRIIDSVPKVMYLLIGPEPNLELEQGDAGP